MLGVPVMIKMDNKAVVTVAKITVNRTKFDIKYGSASFFESIGDKAISDDFEIEVNIAAVNAAPAATVTKKPIVKKKAATSSK